MKLSKHDFTGVGKVFRFTLAAHVKNRSNLVSLMIMLLLALASVPLAVIFSGGSAIQAEHSGIEAVYIRNETTFALDMGVLSTDAYFSNTQFSPLTAQEDVQPDPGSIAVEIQAENEGYYSIALHTAPEDEWDDGEIAQLKRVLNLAFDEARLRAAGADETQIALASMPFFIELATQRDYRSATDISFDTKFAVQYVYSIFVMMISVMAASYIARAIVEEKASKLVELLMVSVRPLALILGKILAVMAFIFGMFLSIILAFALSYTVSGFFLDVSSISQMLASFGISGQSLNLSPMTVLIVLVSLILGYFTFSILSGISGTCCSTMEDIEYAQLSSILVIMSGYLISCIAAAFTSGPAPIIVSLLPVVSVFCAPVSYVCGNISFPLLCLSWGIQALAVAGLALFCARVYNELLIHRGARVKFRQLLAMAKRPAKEDA